MILVFTSLVLFLLISSIKNFGEINFRHLVIKEGALAAEFRTKALLTGLYWGDPEVVWDEVWPYYRDRQIEIGNFEVISWLGRPINRMVVDSAYTCKGFVDTVKYVEGDRKLKV